MEEEKKLKLICSIDIGLVKMAYSIINEESKVIQTQNFSIKPEKEEDKKRDIAQYQAQIITNITEFIKYVQDTYYPDIWLIEQQIGKYSAKQIEFCVMQAILQYSTAKIKIISPLSKLTMKYCDFKPNKDTKKYNQNKNQSVENCKAWLQQTEQKIDVDRDIADSILQALFYIKKFGFD